MEDEQVATFISITSATPEVARGFINLANDNVERAIELFFEDPDLVTNVQVDTGSRASNVPAIPSNPTTSASRVGREDASGVIHIDSDDEDTQFKMDEDEDDGGHIARTNAAMAAAVAQEEEDAAMAQRLQDELYRAGNGEWAGEEERVRAPIARTTETLVAPDPMWSGNTRGYHDPMALVNQLRQQRQAGTQGPAGRGPFAQRIWDADNDEVTPSAVSSRDPHAQRLADLFRPPYELMTRGISWDEAREAGKAEKKWIMVNLQDMSDFHCQALNRDIWQNLGVATLVKENFIFLQYDKEYPNSEEYITFYFPGHGHENPDNYPHVSIIDPRTGEQVKVWSGRPFPSAVDFHAEVVEFLDRYSLEANSKNPVAKPSARKPQRIDVDRMTEDEMLEMALKNSLANQEAGSSGSSSTPNIHDPDALTKHDDVEGKGKEPAAPVSKFAQISSTNPHQEPDNDPAKTTRIQFRHPTGRVIRRFYLQERVQQLYEWLKAAPLEGRDGIEFELKKMPQGQDLLDMLELTIEEAGLKQGTVMIEFIED